MSITIKGADGKYRVFTSMQLYQKHMNDLDLSDVHTQICASIGTELENIRELLESLVKDKVG